MKKVVSMSQVRRMQYFGWLSFICDVCDCLVIYRREETGPPNLNMKPVCEECYEEAIEKAKAAQSANGKTASSGSHGEDEGPSS